MPKVLSILRKDRLKRGREIARKRRQKGEEMKRSQILISFYFKEDSK